MTTTASFLLGFVLLLLGADSLLRAVSGLLRGGGLSATSTALLLLGLVAAAPQLSVNAYALTQGAQALAFGHAIGGSLASLGLALGLVALVAPLRAGMRLLAAQAIALLVAAALVLVFCLDGALARWEGGVLLAAYAGWLVFAFRRGALEGAPVQAELAAFAETATGLSQNLVRLAFAAPLLYFGSRWVVLGAPLVGAALGLDPLATGMTLVAAGTALTGIAMAGMAALNGQGSVVLGQVLGACLCNLLLSVGAIALVAAVSGAGGALYIALPATLVLALLLFLLLRGGAQVGRREGALLVCAFLAWLGVVVGGAAS